MPDWKQNLDNFFDQVEKRKTQDARRKVEIPQLREEFLDQTALPALEEFAAYLKSKNYEVDVQPIRTDAGLTGAQITMQHPDTRKDWKYVIEVREPTLEVYLKQQLRGTSVKNPLGTPLGRLGAVEVGMILDALEEEFKRIVWEDEFGEDYK